MHNDHGTSDCHYQHILRMIRSLSGQESLKTVDWLPLSPSPMKGGDPISTKPKKFTMLDDSSTFNTCNTAHRLCTGLDRLSERANVILERAVLWLSHHPFHPVAAGWGRSHITSAELLVVLTPSPLKQSHQCNISVLLSAFGVPPSLHIADITCDWP